jgi:hypothetical protein
VISMTTGPDTASVTPRPRQRSSSFNRNLRNIDLRFCAGRPIGSALQVLENKRA